MSADLIITDYGYDPNAEDLAAFEAEKERLAALIASIRARIIMPQIVMEEGK